MKKKVTVDNKQTKLAWDHAQSRASGKSSSARSLTRSAVCGLVQGARVCARPSVNLASWRIVGARESRILKADWKAHKKVCAKNAADSIPITPVPLEQMPEAPQKASQVASTDLSTASKLEPSYISRGMCNYFMLANPWSEARLN